MAHWLPGIPMNYAICRWQPNCSGWGGTHMHALIADDDRGTTAILAKALQRWNVEVSIAADGVAAWDRLLAEGSRRPLLALIDWMMPGIDGPELCRRIRRHPALENMYVILLTGRDSRADMVT